ncbi:hypothetical protein K7X08_021565 [Anisodus acutangulus]|uniref:RNase H type-1 domain-containing protein n=1 Tax=Anisodus acutangulus TaxID=402998 RepID=A0A9Q1M4I4_9SOLA|nr:hypothetical protein K7X08_021565 [Anisodus acutangulus]
MQRYLEKEFVEDMQTNMTSKEFAEILGNHRGPRRLRCNGIPPLSEALKLGLARCVEGKLNAQKLIVESDNVILVQYVNGRPEPNEITMSRLKEIFDLLKRITCAVYHVYEEANEAARDLALRDECPNSA